LGSKPVPVSVKVPEVPTTALCGKTDARTGVGLSTVNAKVDDAAAPGFTTAISAVSPEVRLEAGMTAVREVALMRVVERVLPLNVTTAPVAKPEPVTCRVVAAAPACTLFGATLVKAAT
jgi:hypothetical protein